jgi:hypothetical protein
VGMSEAVHDALYNQGGERPHHIPMATRSFLPRASHLNSRTPRLGGLLTMRLLWPTGNCTMQTFSCGTRKERPAGRFALLGVVRFGDDEGAGTNLSKT